MDLKGLCKNSNFAKHTLILVQVENASLASYARVYKGADEFVLGSS